MESELPQPETTILIGWARRVTHIVIARACDEDPAGPHTQMRAQHYGEPPQTDLDTYRKTVTKAYERFFEGPPVRVGVAVLPFVIEEDDPDAEDIAAASGDKPEILNAAAELAAGVESFLSSLPYTAPEAIEFQAKVKLAEPLAEFRDTLAKTKEDSP